MLEQVICSAFIFVGCLFAIFAFLIKTADIFFVNYVRMMTLGKSE